MTEGEGAANGRLTPLQPIAQFYFHTAGKYIYASIDICIFDDLSGPRALGEAKVVPYVWAMDNTLHDVK